MERLYHNIAQQAFKFCLKYQRKTEFRKLCDKLSQHPDFDRFIESDQSPVEKIARLAVLLALSQSPTMLTLLKDCVRFGVVGAAGKKLQDLYKWLEVDFHPLNLCAKVEFTTIE